MPFISAQLKLAVTRKMSARNHSSIVEAIRRLKNEIDSLTAKQSKTRSDSVYVRMTPAEAKAYELRKQQISRLAVQLAQLERTLRNG